MAKPISKNNTKKRKVKFSLKAPNAKKVLLMGDFNKWNPKSHPMKSNSRGEWEKVALLPPGKYEYKFLVDGEWKVDPNNNEVCWNCFGTNNSIITVN